VSKLKRRWLYKKELIMSEKQIRKNLEKLLAIARRVNQPQSTTVAAIVAK
jgi:hypothetical protein